MKIAILKTVRIPAITANVVRTLLIPSALCVCSVLSVYAQSLSRSGAAHLRAAQTLKSMASTTDDNLQVAEEFEKIIESDPSYAEAYLEAARIYSTLVPHLGTTVYDKAENLFRHYAELRLVEASDVDAELIVLEAMLRKYNNGPNRLDGIWSVWSRGYNKYMDILEIRNSGTDVRLLAPHYLVPGDVRNVDVSVNGEQCTIVIKCFWNNRPSLREKGWSYYVDDCDGKADAGYPRSGEYKYNESLNTWYFVVDFSKTPLVLHCSKIHNDYFFNGAKTYSETENNPEPWFYDHELSKAQN